MPLRTFPSTNYKFREQQKRSSHGPAWPALHTPRHRLSTLPGWRPADRHPGTLPFSRFATPQPALPGCPGRSTGRSTRCGYMSRSQEVFGPVISKTAGGSALGSGRSTSANPCTGTQQHPRPPTGPPFPLPCDHPLVNSTLRAELTPLCSGNRAGRQSCRPACSRPRRTGRPGAPGCIWCPE